ncbi:MAG: PEGA domain-containing protein [Fibromonadaceae bacterium]|jgi:hypothetical protein|nr:PEGA domain-containing protein [Fibromonadaceae bacterium]
MNLKFKFFTAFFLLLAVSVWAGKWTIDSFDDSPDPGDPDKYIDGDLKPVPPGQVSQQSNTLYVRQKFEDTFGDEGATYQIFKGRPTAEAKSLGKISVDGIPYGTLLKMKLFYKRNATGDDDLETVYFDGKDILVEGSDPVYINLNGKMEELKPVVLMDFKVSLTSEPAGATVTIGGASKGNTPLTFNLASQKTVTAIITKDGYYTVVKPITPSTKQMVQEGVALMARKSLDNPATAYKTKLQTVRSDKNAIKNLRADVKKTLDNYNSDSKKAIDALMSKYPQNPQKASEESSSDYSARQTIWSNAQTKEREILNKESLGIFNELKELLAEIDGNIKNLDAPAPAVVAKKPPPPPADDDDDDEDAEYDEDEDDEEVEKGVAAQEKYDYSKYGATGNATQIFGNTDEYLFWTGMAFLASAIGNGVVGVLQTMKYRDAKKALDETQGEISRIKEQIRDSCDDRHNKDPNVDANWCTAQVIKWASGKDLDTGKPIDGMDEFKAVEEGRPLWILGKHEAHNQKVTDSYQKGWMIFYSAAALSLGISITLFAW